jgi:hypothetical protein
LNIPESSHLHLPPIVRRAYRVHPRTMMQSNAARACFVVQLSIKRSAIEVSAVPDTAQPKVVQTGLTASPSRYCPGKDGDHFDPAYVNAQAAQQPGYVGRSRFADSKWLPCRAVQQEHAVPRRVQGQRCRAAGRSGSDDQYVVAMVDTIECVRRHLGTAVQ